MFPSNPGNKGKHMTTIKFSLSSIDFMIRFASVSTTQFSTSFPAVEEMKN